MKKSKKFNKGFTLVEIMAVLVILGILATLAMLNLNPVLDRANLEKIRADMATTGQALELYRFNELTYPTTSQGLDALINPHSELKNPFLFPKVDIFQQFQKIHGEEITYMNILQEDLQVMIYILLVQMD